MCVVSRVWSGSPLMRHVVRTRAGPGAACSPLCLAALDEHGNGGQDRHDRDRAQRSQQSRFGPRRGGP